MTQPLYTEQDNQDLNAQVEAKVHARGESPFFTPIDELPFIETPAQPPVPTPAMNQKASFTEGGITVTAPANPNVQLDPAMIRAAQAQLEEGGAVVLGQDGSTKMYSNIRDMFEKPTVTKRAFETFFVAHQAKASFSIDRTIFEPSAIVRLSGKSFAEKYVAQLESYIYNGKDELEPDNLFAIIFVAGLIKEGKFPLKLITGKHRIQLPKIVAGLNTFFNKNYSVIMGIYTMFNGMQVQQPQAPQKAE